MRKKLLLARSNLHRLEIRKDLLAIGDTLALSGAGGGGQFSLRDRLFDFLVGRLTGAPVARLLGVLSGAVSLAQVLRIGTSIVREAGSGQKERASGDQVVVERLAP